MLDLTIPSHAYFYGFMLTDGHLTEESRNRGKLTIELSIIDEHILNEFRTLFPINSTQFRRTRKTNFGICEGCGFSIFDLSFRNELKEYGFPAGKKSDIIDKPIKEFSEIDFIRGLIDGDGSIGFVRDNKYPFISFTTASEKIKEYYIGFLENRLGYRKIVNRNQRDNIYNIMITRDDALTIYKILYYDGCMSLNRKRKDDILLWNNPYSNRVKKQMWNNEQDKIILDNTINDSIILLNRSEKSIKSRLWRLKHGN